MKERILKNVLAALLLIGALASCKKDKVESNDEEVITTMKLSFVPVGGGTTLTYQFDDPDGPGGTAPTQDEIVLAPSKTYDVRVQLLNKTANPVADITTEVEAEAEAHRFYYQPSLGNSITVDGLDTDPKGVSLGVGSVWYTSLAGTGTMKITLRHYPAVPPNKAQDDPANSPKSGTDIEVTFATKVQ